MRKFSKFVNPKATRFTCSRGCSLPSPRARRLVSLCPPPRLAEGAQCDEGRRVAEALRHDVPGVRPAPQAELWRIGAESPSGLADHPQVIGYVEGLDLALPHAAVERTGAACLLYEVLCECRNGVRRVARSPKRSMRLRPSTPRVTVTAADDRTKRLRAVCKRDLCREIGRRLPQRRKLCSGLRVDAEPKVIPPRRESTDPGSL
jgi:hypothetical protein